MKLSIKDYAIILLLATIGFAVVLDAVVTEPPVYTVARKAGW